MNKKQEKQQKARFKRKGDAFLKELTELTRKHGVAVGGCGCCESPYLLPVKDTTVKYTYVYTDEYGFGDIRFGAQR